MRKLVQLLDRGAKANGSILLFASQTGNQKWMHWTLGSDIDIDRYVLQEAVVEASWYGDVKIMGLLLDGGAEVTNAILEGAYQFSDVRSSFQR